MKDENAIALGKSRWKNSTPEERSAHAKMMARKYWDSRSQEEKQAHMARARAARKPKNGSN